MLKFPDGTSDIPIEMEERAGSLSARNGQILAGSLLVAATLCLLTRPIVASITLGAVAIIVVLVQMRGRGEPTRRETSTGDLRLADLHALVAASMILQTEGRGEALADLLARQASSILNARGAAVHLVDASGDLIRAAVYGCYVPEIGLDGMVGEALHEGRVLPMTLDGAPALVVPLIGSKGNYGLIVLVSPERSWLDPFTINVARLYGSQAGLAIERLRVIEDLTEATMRDPLTGVGNRRRASALLEGLRPDDAVLLVDLDRFKQVNDNDGHVAGDAVLVALAHHLRDRLRADDVVARYGGEEFLVVLRGVGDRATAAAERLWSTWRAAAPRTTFSVGVAIHRPDATARNTFLQADTALLRAKREGRDRVRFYDPDGAAEPVTIRMGTAPA